MRTILILLHGGSETRHAWNALRPYLGDEFTLVIPDRRGRGDSGDANEYDLAREVSDLAALVDTLGGDVSVFGHSFGGLVSLAAAEKIELEQLVLYEPSILIGEHATDADLTDRMRDLVRIGDREGAMKLFYQDGAGIPDPEQLPVWPHEVNFDPIDTVIRENAAVESYDLPADIALEAPTLLLTGERGPRHLRDAARTLDDRLPNSRLVELAGVGHVGTLSAPEQVATAVQTFLQKSQNQV